MIYLDSAATSLLKPSEVVRAVTEAMTQLTSPSRGNYPQAQDAAELVYSCREEAAQLFHAKPEQIIFTMNATHALNLAIHSLVKPGDRVLISGYEHNAVYRPLIAAGAQILVARSPLFDRDAALKTFLEKMDFCDAVVCTHVSNVFGFIMPIEEIAEECRKRKLPLIVDAAQSAGTLQVDAEKWGAAFIAMPGHKGLMGPQGTGILICNHDTLPLLYGGTGSDSRNLYMPELLPERLEAGTLNVPGIAGLCEGIRYIRKVGTENLRIKEAALMKCFVKEASYGELHFFQAKNKKMQCGVLSAQVGGVDCETLAEILGENGIAVRAGLHCAPLAHETVGTLQSGTVRFSFSPLLSFEEVIQAGRIIKKLQENNYNL